MAETQVLVQAVVIPVKVLTLVQVVRVVQIVDGQAYMEVVVVQTEEAHDLIQAEVVV